MTAGGDEASALLAWAMIVGIGAVSFAIRFIPIVLIARLGLPERFKRALAFVPPAVMRRSSRPHCFLPAARLPLPSMYRVWPRPLLPWSSPGEHAVCCGP